MAELGELPFTYAQAGDMAKRLGNRLDCLQLPREWLEFFRGSYARAAVLARAQGPARAGLTTDAGDAGRSRDLLQVTRTQATSGGT
jgi:hypothetical protein